MDKDNLRKAIQASISEVMETMFFMPVDLLPAGQGAGGADAPVDPLVVRLDFKGPVAAGRFSLRVPPPLARAVSLDFLGIAADALTDSDVTGTVKEMINMLAGNTLSHYDPEVVFDLGVPQLVPQAGADGRPAVGVDRVGMDILTPAGQMSLGVWFGGAR